MTRKPPPLEKLIGATQGLLRSLIRRETVRLRCQAKSVKQQTEYRMRRAEHEQEEMKKLKKKEATKP